MVVRVKNLVKRYGEIIALDHFTLEVREGEIFGLLGPNGSGKTTAINCILSLLKYDKGEIEVFGRPMRPDSYDSKRDIGVVPQNVAVFREMTVEENVDYFCGLYVPDKKRRRELIREAIAFVGLESYAKFYPKKLSGGLLRRLNIACGIAHRPRLIVLDEPTVAVDPQSRNSILEGIMEMSRQGATVIYTSHYMEEVERICSRVAIMDRGKVIAQGTVDELKGMIRAGEKITVELLKAGDGDVEGLKGVCGVKSVDIAGTRVVLRTEDGRSALASVLEYLSERKVAYGKILCEVPTLNDVFLEITGKELRD